MVSRINEVGVATAGVEAEASDLADSNGRTADFMEALVRGLGAASSSAVQPGRGCDEGANIASGVTGSRSRWTPA